MATESKSMPREQPELGLGIGWRPELAMVIDSLPNLGFIEIVAEDFHPRRIPRAIDKLRERGVKVIPHGVGLSLGSVARPDQKRIDHLARLAERLGSPLVSEHAAFVRAGGLETGHLLPLPRTELMLEILCENIAIATAKLPVPLALENISAIIAWPDSTMDEPEFFSRLTAQSSALLLLDIENIYANSINHRIDAVKALLSMPLAKTAYAHVAGGIMRDNSRFYHDTHTAAIPEGVFSLLKTAAAQFRIPGVMIERDGDFPPDEELRAELAAVASAMKGGAA